MLKTFVDSIKPVWQVLTGAVSEEPRKVCQVGVSGDQLALELRSVKLCDPETYRRAHKLISSTLNEDVTYSAQPLEMRNQRAYAIQGTLLMARMERVVG